MPTPELPQLTTPAARSKRRWGLVVAWNLATFLLLAELAGIAAYAWRSRSFFYTNPPVGKSVPTTPEGTAEGYRIHPYFGYVLQPDSHSEGTTTNSHGFDEVVDYPYVPQADEVLVGVFGGSVASKLAAFERRQRVMAPLIADALGVSPQQVRVLNFAQGGYKQPQQVQLLGYFLALGQRFDAVINIDGFNEVALGALNQQAGIAAAMPSFEHVGTLREMVSMLPRQQLQAMLETRQAYGRFAEIYNRAWSGDALENRSAAGFLLHYLRYRHYKRQFDRGRLALMRQDVDQRGGQSWLYLDRAQNPGEVDWPSVIEAWRQGAVLFSAAARSVGAVPVQAIQPNQYVATERVFSSQEKALALSPMSPYRSLVDVGYRRLRAAADELAVDGLEIESLVTLFDDLDAIAYEDDCCHYTDAGNQLLAERLGRLTSERLRAGGRLPTEDHHRESARQTR